MNVSGRNSGSSATELGILLPSKGALTPNGDVTRVIGHKSHKNESSLLPDGHIGARGRA